MLPTLRSEQRCKALLIPGSLVSCAVDASEKTKSTVQQDSGNRNRSFQLAESLQKVDSVDYLDENPLSSRRCQPSNDCDRGGQHQSTRASCNQDL